MAPPRASWPDGFPRVPDDAWTTAPVERLAQSYDTVDKHGWYANLDPTVEAVAGRVHDGALLVDYSGGTGILIDRLLSALPSQRFHIVNVDASPKFLRLALEKLRDEPRVAFRLLHWRGDEKRLDRLDEIVGPLAGQVDGICCTNAVHLYPDLDDTFRSWARVLAPGAWVHVQSGNIGRDDATRGPWIIDETVHAIADAAESITRDDDRYAPYRGVLDDAAVMMRYHELRRRYFLPVRPVSFYTDRLSSAGFAVEAVTRRAIEARTSEWLQFLSVYHEGILGWVGGAEKVTGKPPTDAAVADRMRLLHEAADVVFEGAPLFAAEWTYIRATRGA